MHDLLYAHQKEWNRERRPREILTGFAKRLGLDVERFDQCMKSGATAERTEKADQVARGLLIRQTPTFFVNGRRALGALPITEWRKIIAQVRSGR